MRCSQPLCGCAAAAAFTLRKTSRSPAGRTMSTVFLKKMKFLFLTQTNQLSGSTSVSSAQTAETVCYRFHNHRNLQLCFINNSDSEDEEDARRKKVTAARQRSVDLFLLYPLNAALTLASFNHHNIRQTGFCSSDL